MAIEGGDRHAHALGHVAHRQLALFHQRARRGDVACLERRRASALASAAACLGEAGGGAFADQGALELRDRSEHMEHQHAAWRGGVDALGQRHQPDAAFLELLGRRDQLLQRPGEPVELPHDQHVALAQHVVEHAREFGPVRLRAGRLLGVDLLAAGTPKRVELQLGRLVGRADPGVADPHPAPHVLKTRQNA